MTRERPARRGLGRGLGSLIPTAPADPAESSPQTSAAEADPQAAGSGPDLVQKTGLSVTHIDLRRCACFPALGGTITCLSG